MNTLKSVLSKLSKQTKLSRVQLSLVSEMRQQAEMTSYDKMNYDEVESFNRDAVEIMNLSSELMGKTERYLNQYNYIQEMYGKSFIKGNIEKLETLIFKVEMMFDELGVMPSGEDYEYALFAVQDMQNMLDTISGYESNIDIANDLSNDLGL